MKAKNNALSITLLILVRGLIAQVSTVQLPQDKGPDKINVAAYGETFQKTYGLDHNPNWESKFLTTRRFMVDLRLMW